MCAMQIPVFFPSPSATLSLYPLYPRTFVHGSATIRVASREEERNKTLFAFLLVE